jgi:hypothetical protein
MLGKLRDKFSVHNLLGLIYFYLNTVLLPVPVTFTSILSISGLKKAFLSHKKTILGLLLILAIYTAIHFYFGVVPGDYLKSLAFFTLLILSGFVTYHYLKDKALQIDNSFKLLAGFGFLLVIVALICINTPFEQYFWTSHNFVGGGEKIRRFKGLAYEPSHLALTLSPLLLYFIWKNIEKISVKRLLYFVAIAIPIGLSISFGFVASLLIALVFTLLIALLVFREFKRVLILPVLGVLLGVAAISFTENPVSERMEYIFTGNDTSVNGRTTEAFMHGYNCAATKSIWFGIGLGQIKYVGETVIRPYYAAMDQVGYSKENWPVMNIPNSLAETLAIFGILGVLLKIGFQLFCFVKFKVYDNYLNLSIFCFIFFYQMMGSFILSSTEIIMWAFAFAKIYPEFNVKNEPGLRES